MLLELANSGMGALRSAFLGEQFRFAASTPKAIVLRPAAQTGEVEAQRVLAFCHQSTVIHALLVVRHQGRITVRAGLLREAMVLATDVFDATGVLLARAGTPLSETAAEKIARLLPQLEFELSDSSEV